MFRSMILALSALVPVCPAIAQCAVSAPALSFPAYQAFSGSASNASTTLTVGCNALLTLFLVYDVRLSSGQSGTILDRRMLQASSGNNLRYQVYRPGGQVWGNGVQGQSISGSIPLGIGYVTHTFSITATIPANQQVNAGAYSDSLVMTIIY